MKQRKPMAIRKEPELKGKFGHYLTTVNGMEMYRRKKEDLDVSCPDEWYVAMDGDEDYIRQQEGS